MAVVVVVDVVVVVVVVVIVVVVAVVVVVVVVVVSISSEGDVKTTVVFPLLLQASKISLSPQSTSSAQQSPSCTQWRLGELKLKYWFAGQILYVVLYGSMVHSIDQKAAQSFGSG